MPGSTLVTAQDRLVDPEARLQHALDLCYRHLGQRDRTVAEIRRHLECKRIEPETIDHAVAELEQVQLGMEDPSGFITNWTDSWFTNAPMKSGCVW